MYYLGKISYLTSLFHLLFIFILLLEVFLVIRVDSLNFSYPKFTKQNENDFITTEHSYIAFDALQVTGDARGTSISNLSGRIWYSQPLNLWNRKKNITASFNSTFVINITPQSGPWGEGLAFILTKESGPDSIPETSHGQWLGIVNPSTNGSNSNNIFAVEFDTRKSYLDDLDDNHVGIDINSINSVNQVSLTDRGVNLSRAIDVIARIEYDGESKFVKVYTFMSNQTGDNERNPIISMPIDLSRHLPEDVFVGFSASTGIYNQLNCIKAWNFTSTEIRNNDEVSLLWLWILIPVISVLVMLLSGVLVYFTWRRKKKRMQVLDQSENIEIQIKNSATAPQRFQLKDLKRATGNFDPKNILGRGGCGVVMKGLLADHKEVAVKRFFNDSSQRAKDLIAEVTTIGNLHHKNLVKLIGWCYESNELLVVYEFMPNGSLDKLIFCEENGEIRLNWERMHGIICGVAQALDYLHNGCQKRVLHRDIKASNIMLDSELNARLGDFGLARTVQVNGKTHHSTKEIAGTIGYMAPESFHIGRATVETDVFAFGVLVLEVACGRKPGQYKENNYSNRVIEYVWDLYKIGRIIDAIDARLDRDFDEEQAECVLILGLACCHPNPYERPTMKTVLQILTGESLLPNIPTEKPAFVWPARAPSSNEAAGDSLQEGQLTPITVLSGR